MSDLHVVPTDSDEERIRSAVEKLVFGSKVSRQDALDRGEKDDACPRCPKVLLAGQNRYDCGCAECPYKMSSTERRKKYPKHLLIDPDQPSLL